MTSIYGMKCFHNKFILCNLTMQPNCEKLYISQKLIHIKKNLSFFLRRRQVLVSKTISMMRSAFARYLYLVHGDFPHILLVTRVYDIQKRY